MHLSADAFRRENFLFFASAHGTYCASKRGESFLAKSIRPFLSFTESPQCLTLVRCTYPTQLERNVPYGLPYS